MQNPYDVEVNPSNATKSRWRIWVIFFRRILAASPCTMLRIRRDDGFTNKENEPPEERAKPSVNTYYSFWNLMEVFRLNHFNIMQFLNQLQSLMATKKIQRSNYFCYAIRSVSFNCFPFSLAAVEKKLTSQLREAIMNFDLAETELREKYQKVEARTSDQSKEI